MKNKLKRHSFLLNWKHLNIPLKCSQSLFESPAYMCLVWKYSISSDWAEWWNDIRQRSSAQHREKLWAWREQDLMFQSKDKSAYLIIFKNSYKWEKRICFQFFLIISNAFQKKANHLCTHENKYYSHITITKVRKKMRQGRVFEKWPRL